MYFNADGCYPTLGAAETRVLPGTAGTGSTTGRFLRLWWGIRTFCQQWIPLICGFHRDGKDSIIRRWLRAGASGWRLDVADELPDWFLEKIRAAMERQPLTTS